MAQRSTQQPDKGTSATGHKQNGILDREEVQRIEEFYALLVRTTNQMKEHEGITRKPTPTLIDDSTREGGIVKGTHTSAT